MSEFPYEEVVPPLAGVISSFREDVTTPIDWQIVPTPGEFGAGVDFVAGVMAVPLTGDSHSDLVRLREAVRVRTGVRNDAIYKQMAEFYKNNGITESVLRAAEVARNSAITRKFADVKGIVDEPDGSEKTVGRRLATANTMQSWDQAVEYTLKHFGTKAFDSFASGVRSVNSDWSKQLRSLSKRLSSVFNGSAGKLGNTAPTGYGGIVAEAGFQYSLYAADAVKDYLSSGYKAPEDIKFKMSEANEKRAQNYGKPDPLDPRGELTPENVEIEDDLPDDFDFDEESGFGNLRICETMPLTVEVAGYMHRKRRAMTSGRRIAYPSRMLTDPQRRVFGSKVKVKGGIVVIDISGSMSLNQSDIESIVEAAPAAVILAYSDCGDDPDPNAWLLANRGWRVRDIGDIGGMNNGVDGPAITWAIRQRHRNEPIIWVTDGQVTGMSGSAHSELALDCAKLVKKHKIIMIPSVAEAVKQFKAGRFINKPAGRVRSALLGYFH